MKKINKLKYSKILEQLKYLKYFPFKFLKYYNYFLKQTQFKDSLILSTLSMRNYFIDLCEIPIDSKWTLTYRATEHGFGFNDFHLKCAEQEKCLTIVKSENGNVFGGYIDGA